MISASAAILTVVADAFFTALVENLAGDVYDKLKSDPARNAFKQALGSAIHRYATGPRLRLAEPLVREKGFLTESVVVTELTHLVRFDQEPDAKKIGEWWRLEFEVPPVGRDFTNEASLFIRYLQNELRDTDVFRPAFEAKDLNRVAVNASIASDHLARIEVQLGSLIELIGSQFGSINTYFLNTTSSIRNQIRDYTSYIEEKTQDFVGRQFILDAIDNFMENNQSGYVFVRGDPGIGKTALAAQIIKTRGYLHHFNIRAEGINKASDFLKSVCSQLIAVYNLEYAVLPPEATQDGGFFRKLLEEVSSQLDGQRCVIVVDALDEVENMNLSSGANTLYLPLTLPHGIYIICTMRRETDENMPIRVDMSEQLELFIEQDDEGNIADVREYIVNQTPRHGIQTYIQKQEISDEFFIDHMVEKSQGNFIYLRMVLPEVAQGAYTDLDFGDIPVGLSSYYQDHWRRMRQQNELDWFDHKLPVIIALSVVREPVSIDLLSDFSGVEDRRRIRAILLDFDQFIYKTNVNYDSGKQRHYRWYHASFFEFIAKKEEVADERVDLVEGHRKIADTMWDQLFNK